MWPLSTSVFVLSLLLVAKQREGAALIAVAVVNIVYFEVSTSLFAFGQTVPYNLYDAAKIETYRWVQWLILLHFLVVYIGLLVAQNLVRSRANISFSALNHVVIHVRRLGAWAFLVCLSPVFFMLLAVDLGDLVERPSFSFDQAQHGWMRFADLFFWVAALATPFLRAKWQRIVVLVILTTFFAMLGSRSAPVLLLMYVLIERYVLRVGSTAKQFLLVALSLGLLAILLSLRPLNQGGLVAILAQIGRISFVEWMDFLAFGTNYFVNYSIAINAEMLIRGADEARWFLYSILPVPSFLFDLTTEFDAATRFRANVPYPGFGYAIAFLGPVPYLLFVFVGSLGLGALRQIVATRRDAVERGLFLASIALPFLISLQYNLRTATRVGYFLLVLYVAASLIRRLRFRAVKARET